MLLLSFWVWVQSSEALATGRTGAPECLAGVTSVSIQPVEVVVYRPTYISLHVTANTVLIFDDTHTIHVSEAPVLLVTEIGRFETSSQVHSRTSPRYYGGELLSYLTVTGNYDGSITSTVTLAPLGPSDPGTVIIWKPITGKLPGEDEVAASTSTKSWESRGSKATLTEANISEIPPSTQGPSRGKNILGRPGSEFGTITSPPGSPALAKIDTITAEVQIASDTYPSPKISLLPTSGPGALGLVAVSRTPPSMSKTETGNKITSRLGRTEFAILLESEPATNPISSDSEAFESTTDASSKSPTASRASGAITPSSSGEVFTQGTDGAEPRLLFSTDPETTRTSNSESGYNHSIADDRVSVPTTSTNLSHNASTLTIEGSPTSILDRPTSGPVSIKYKLETADPEEFSNTSKGTPYVSRGASDDLQTTKAPSKDYTTSHKHIGNIEIDESSRHFGISVPTLSHVLETSIGSFDDESTSTNVVMPIDSAETLEAMSSTEYGAYTTDLERNVVHHESGRSAQPTGSTSPSESIAGDPHPHKMSEIAPTNSGGGVEGETTGSTQIQTLNPSAGSTSGNITRYRELIGEDATPQSGQLSTPRPESGQNNSTYPSMVSTSKEEISIFSTRSSDTKIGESQIDTAQQTPSTSWEPHVGTFDSDLLNVEKPPESYTTTTEDTKTSESDQSRGNPGGSPSIVDAVAFSNTDSPELQPAQVVTELYSGTEQNLTLDYHGFPSSTSSSSGRSTNSTPHSSLSFVKELEEEHVNSFSSLSVETFTPTSVYAATTEEPMTEGTTENGSTTKYGSEFTQPTADPAPEDSASTPKLSESALNSSERTGMVEHEDIGDTSSPLLPGNLTTPHSTGQNPDASETVGTVTSHEETSITTGDGEDSTPAELEIDFAESSRTSDTATPLEMSSSDDENVTSSLMTSEAETSDLSTPSMISSDEDSIATGSEDGTEVLGTKPSPALDTKKSAEEEPPDISTIQISDFETSDHVTASDEDTTDTPPMLTGKEEHSSVIEESMEVSTTLALSSGAQGIEVSPTPSSPAEQVLESSVSDKESPPTNIETHFASESHSESRSASSEDEITTNATPNPSVTGDPLRTPEAERTSREPTQEGSPRLEEVSDTSDISIITTESSTSPLPADPTLANSTSNDIASLDPESTPWDVTNTSTTSGGSFEEFIPSTSLTAVDPTIIEEVSGTFFETETTPSAGDTITQAETSIQTTTPLLTPESDPYTTIEEQTPRVATTSESLTGTPLDSSEIHDDTATPESARLDGADTSSGLEAKFSTESSDESLSDGHVTESSTTNDLVLTPPLPGTTPLASLSSAVNVENTSASSTSETKTGLDSPIEETTDTMLSNTPNPSIEVSDSFSSPDSTPAPSNPRESLDSTLSPQQNIGSPPAGSVTASPEASEETELSSESVSVFEVVDTPLSSPSPSDRSVPSTQLEEAETSDAPLPSPVKPEEEVGESTMDDESSAPSYSTVDVDTSGSSSISSPVRRETSTRVSDALAMNSESIDDGENPTPSGDTTQTPPPAKTTSIDALSATESSETASSLIENTLSSSNVTPGGSRSSTSPLETVTPSLTSSHLNSPEIDTWAPAPVESSSIDSSSRPSISAFDTDPVRSDDPASTSLATEPDTLSTTSEVSIVPSGPSNNADDSTPSPSLDPTSSESEDVSTSSNLEVPAITSSDSVISSTENTESSASAGRSSTSSTLDAGVSTSSSSIQDTTTVVDTNNIGPPPSVDISSSTSAGEASISQSWTDTSSTSSTHAGANLINTSSLTTRSSSSISTSATEPELIGSSASLTSTNLGEEPKSSLQTTVSITASPSSSASSSPTSSSPPSSSSSIPITSSSAPTSSLSLSSTTVSSSLASSETASASDPRAATSQSSGPATASTSSSTTSSSTTSSSTTSSSTTSSSTMSSGSASVSSPSKTTALESSVPSSSLSVASTLSSISSTAPLSSADSKPTTSSSVISFNNPISGSTSSAVVTSSTSLYMPSSSALSSTSSSSTTRMPTASSSSTTTCFPAPTATPSICLTNTSPLPGACASLSGATSLASLTLLVAQCQLDLGPIYAVGKVLDCLTQSILSLSAGARITACLQSNLSGKCITRLPDACASLEASVAPLPQTQATACLRALGPFSAGAPALCLAANVLETTTGISAIGCLENALGLPRNSTYATGTRLCSPSTRGS